MSVCLARVSRICLFDVYQTDRQTERRTDRQRQRERGDRHTQCQITTSAHNSFVYVCMYVAMFVCKYVCMYVYMHMFIHFHTVYITTHAKCIHTTCLYEYPHNMFIRIPCAALDEQLSRVDPVVLLALPAPPGHVWGRLRSLSRPSPYPHNPCPHTPLLPPPNIYLEGWVMKGLEKEGGGVVKKRRVLFF